jgi:hypothetical protein
MRGKLRDGFVHGSELPLGSMRSLPRPGPNNDPGVQILDVINFLDFIKRDMV